MAEIVVLFDIDGPDGVACDRLREAGPGAARPPLNAGDGLLRPSRLARHSGGLLCAAQARYLVGQNEAQEPGNARRRHRSDAERAAFGAERFDRAA